MLISEYSNKVKETKDRKKQEGVTFVTLSIFCRSFSRNCLAYIESVLSVKPLVHHGL